MPNSVLNQLKALRDGVAQELRKDPRYLTLQALDKSIEEISSVLSTSGLLPPGTPPSALAQRLGALAPKADPYEEPVAVLSVSAQTPASETSEHPAAGKTPGFNDGTGGSPQPAVPQLAPSPSVSSPTAASTHGMAALAGAGIIGAGALGAAALAGAFHGEDEPHDAAGHGADEKTAEADAPAARAAELIEEARKQEETAHEAVLAAAHEHAEAEALAPVAAEEHPVEAHHAEEHDAAEHHAEALTHHEASHEEPAHSPLASALAQTDLADELEIEEEEPAAPLAHAEPHEDEAHKDEAHEPAHAAAEEHKAAETTPVAHEPVTHEPVAEAEHPIEPEPAAPTIAEAAADAVAAALFAGELSEDEEEPAEDDHAAAAHEAPTHEASTHEAAAHQTVAHHEEAAHAVEAHEAEAEPHALGEELTAHELAAEEPEAHETVAQETAAHETAAHETTTHEAPAEKSFETVAADAIAAALFGEETAEHAPAAHEAESHPTAAVQQAAELHAGEESHETEAAEAGAHPALEAAAASAIASALFLDDEAPHPQVDHGHVDHHEEPAAAADASVIPVGKASGYLNMEAKPHAATYSPSIAVKFGKLPNKVDLRPLLAPVEDQGHTNSSVALAVASAYEYWIKKATKKNQVISRLFVYYNARWRAGMQEADEGATIQDALEGLQKFGACAEAAWPTIPQLLGQRPGGEAYQAASPYRIHDMAQVPLKLESWKQALAEGKPVIFALAIFPSFAASSQHGGVVTMPAPDEIGHLPHAIHALCAVGYSEAEKVFIVRNSWGSDFGDAGYCYIPYDYVLNPTLNAGDNWIFVPKVPSQPPRETWHDSTDPVTNGGKGVEAPIETHPAETYEGLDLLADMRRPWESETDAGYADYATKVSKSLFSELEPFDLKSFMETTTILAGIGSAITSMVDAPAKAGTEKSAAPDEAHHPDWENEASWGKSTSLDRDRDGGPTKVSA